MLDEAVRCARRLFGTGLRGRLRDRQPGARWLRAGGQRRRPGAGGALGRSVLACPGAGGPGPHPTALRAGPRGSAVGVLGTVARRAPRRRGPGAPARDRPAGPSRARPSARGLRPPGRGGPADPRGARARRRPLRPGLVRRGPGRRRPGPRRAGRVRRADRHQDRPLPGALPGDPAHRARRGERRRGALVRRGAPRPGVAPGGRGRTLAGSGVGPDAAALLGEHLGALHREWATEHRAWLAARGDPDAARVASVEVRLRRS